MKSIRNYIKYVKKNKLFMVIIGLIILAGFIHFIQKKEPFNEDADNLKIAIHTVFILKENLPFLEEWIQHHKKIGIDQFYLYDNTGSVVTNGSTTTNNRYGIHFDKLIKLDDNQLKQEMDKILQKYPEITYIKWQPKTDEGKIHYGYKKSIDHYSKNYLQENDWTIFIDIDEFLYGDIIKQNKLKQFISENQNEFSKIMIKQRKYADRFCNIGKSINQISYMIINVETAGWAEKCIVKNKKLENSKTPEDKDGPMHSIGIKDGEETKWMNVNELCFNHYNVNKKQIDWMKGFFNKKSFKSGKDTENKYNTNINNENMFDLQYYNQVKNDYCYQF